MKSPRTLLRREEVCVGQPVWAQGWLPTWAFPKKEGWRRMCHLWNRWGETWYWLMLPGLSRGSPWCETIQKGQMPPADGKSALLTWAHVSLGFSGLELCGLTASWDATRTDSGVQLFSVPSFSFILFFFFFGLTLGSLGVGRVYKSADRDPWIALFILPKRKEKHNELKTLLKNILRS